MTLHPPPVVVLAPGTVARFWAREQGIDLERVVSLHPGDVDLLRGWECAHVVHLPDWPHPALSAELRAALALLDARDGLLPWPAPHAPTPSFWHRVRGVLTARTRATVIGGHNA
ncbi:hypothetical protein [Aeromicrobium sp. Leaf291]|uniref:hypothetical protein n=1 Tax=Aeromicrobium sp. Leaf291 TaxID=1736325 RepID=UPI0006F70E33|nr:hypothetical protein [Aeromicrobium sp. Leaf291]KQP81617.1 hypothetical protein ASF35_16430 [Aeromicrobium sp. Leaf291]